MVPGGGPPQVRALVRKLWLYRPGGRSSGRRVKTTSASSSSSSAPSIDSGGGGSSLAKAVLSSAATCGAFSLLSDTMVQTMEIRYRANQRYGEEGASSAPAKEMSGKVKAKKFEISRPTQDGEEVVGEVVVVAEPRDQNQKKEGKQDEKGTGYDPYRASRMLSFGFLFYGPLQHFWYGFLDRQFNRKTYLPHFASKVALNQVVLGPVVLMSVFTWNFVLQRKLDQLSDKVRRDFVPSMLNGWKFWVPAACVNFYVVPLKRQVFFMSACSIAWTGYLSYASQARRS